MAVNDGSASDDPEELVFAEERADRSARSLHQALAYLNMRTKRSLHSLFQIFEPGSDLLLFVLLLGRGRRRRSCIIASILSFL